MGFNSNYTGAEVEALLAKAASALQEHQDITGKVDKNAKVLLENATADNDGWASAYDVKTVIVDNEEAIAAALNELNVKVDEVSGKTFTAADIPDLAMSKITGLQDALNAKQDSLSFTSTPSATNKVVTKTELDAAIAGASSYMGTINSLNDLSTTAVKGSFYRIATAWNNTVHVGDIVIAEKDKPISIIDGSNWSLLHNELNTDTTYTFTGGTNGFSVTPLNGTAQTVSVAVTTVNGHTVNADVPSNAKFTDTVYTHPASHTASEISDFESAVKNIINAEYILSIIPDGTNILY